MSKPRIITVSGSGAGVGKTALVEKLLGIIPGCAAVKLRPEEDLSPEVIEETPPEREPNKDTERMLAAGAARALLVQGPAPWTLEKLRKLLRESDCDTVIIESNYAATEIGPDLSFYVKGPGPAKPGALTIEKNADIVVLSSSLTGENTMQREIPDRIKSAVKSKTNDGRLTCRDALAIAERMDVTPRMIGKAADRLGIKIVNCQLGCFK